MKKFVIIDELLTPEECKDCIDYYEEDGFDTTHNLNFVKRINHHKRTQRYVDKILKQCYKHFDEKCKFGWGEIVHWTEGSFQLEHIDDASDKTILTSITYLNDDYEGGETFISNEFNIKPKIGRTIFFYGSSYPHGVTNITKGDRFTLPIWYDGI